MKTFVQIVSRLAALAAATAVSASAPLLISGNKDWWLAALGATAPHVAMALSAIFRAYGSDGKLTQSEIDAAINSVDVSK